MIAFPDVDGYEEWKTKLSLVPGLTVKVSDYLERNASAEGREAHADIADLLLKNVATTSQKVDAPKEYPILQYIAPEHRENVQALIEELGLIPVSIRKLT